MSSAYHVIPTGDIKPHSSHPGCKCEPSVSEDQLLVIHNAFDGREFFEDGGNRLLADAYAQGMMGSIHFDN